MIKGYRRTKKSLEREGFKIVSQTIQVSSKPFNCTCAEDFSFEAMTNPDWMYRHYTVVWILRFIHIRKCLIAKKRRIECDKPRGIPNEH